MTLKAPEMTATSHPSLPNRWRSELMVERVRWRAAVKVDHDHGNPFLIGRVREVLRASKNDETWDGYLFHQRVVDAAVYATRKGHHLRVYFLPGLPKMQAGSILAIQAALGDDPARQRMNAARVARDEPGWNALWNRKVTNGRVTSREVLDEVLTAKVRKVFGLVEGSPTARKRRVG